jgi:DNA-binding transcriptional LysR family regulator
MDFRNFDLNLLQVLEAVDRTGSVTRAARELHLSQPAVSKRLNHLRRIFRDPLFLRTTTGVDSTATAKALVRPIRKSFEYLRKVVELPDTFDPAKLNQTFRLHMNDVGQMVILPKLVTWSTQTAPLVQWDARQGVAGRHYSVSLDSGAADLAIGYFSRTDESLRCQLLFEDPYVGVVRRCHPAIHTEITFEDFLHTPHLLYQPSGGGHQTQDEVIQKAFVAANVSRRVAICLSHASGLAASIDSTDALALLPKTLAQECTRATDLTVLPLPVEIPKVQVAQYWHARNHHDAAHRWLRRGLTHLLQAQSDDSQGTPILATARFVEFTNS